MPKPSKARELTEKIKDLLVDRHSGEVVTKEALLGPSGSQRFDVWAMEPSWVRTRVCGYEVKISRSDFTGDKKWKNYLEYCTEFYFVCPANIIRPEELPPEVGLLWTTSTGSRVYQKKPASPHDIGEEELNLMLRHVLMWRYSSRVSPGAEARDWLRKKKEGEALNWKMRGRIRELADAQAKGLREENEKFKEQNDGFSRLKNWLQVNNIDITKNPWKILSDVQDAVETKQTGVNKELKDLAWEMERTRDSLTQLIKVAKGENEKEE